MAAQPTVSAPVDDSTPLTGTVNFSNAFFTFQQLLTWLRAEHTLTLPADDVEEQLFCQGRELLRLLLEAHFRQRGSGDVGAALLRLDPKPAATDQQAKPPDAPPSPDQTDPTPDPTRGKADPTNPSPVQANPVPLTHKRPHRRTLKTLFGPICILRTGYGAPGQTSIHPLDAQAALPPLSLTYPLQQHLTRSAVQGPYDEAVEDALLLTGSTLSKRTLEKVMQQAACDFQAFYNRPRPAPENTGPLVVAGVDSKGVPMIKPEKTLRQVRLGKGQKRNKKRMATVATVRTQQPWVRTPEAVVASLFDDEPAPPPPLRLVGEEHQRVWASLTQSQEKVIDGVVEEMAFCDPQKNKRHVVVCDGERGQRKKLLKKLPQRVGEAVLVLDLMHVLEKLWQVSYLFYKEGSVEAKGWVRAQTLAILQGKVRLVIKEIRQKAGEQPLRASQQKELEKVVRYYYRNRCRMRYHEYLQEGLPIASGAVEGACKNLVKDRMERSGMRWSLAGGEALLQMRSLYRSGDFEEYWAFHQQQEQKRLHPQGQWQVVQK